MSYARTRRVQRIHLAQPVVARLGTAPVLIVDISVLGARLEHHTPLPTGSSARLAFVWDDVDITVESKIVRSRLERFSVGADGVTVYNAGLEFHNLDVPTRAKLKEMIARLLTAALEEQKMNARGVMPKHSAAKMPIFRHGGQLSANAKDVHDSAGSTPLPIARITKESGYICYMLDNECWRKKKTHDPGQPEEGFTILAIEDTEQAELLCQAYQRSDPNGRKLIQLFAQLAIADGEGATARMTASM